MLSWQDDLYALLREGMILNEDMAQQLDMESIRRVEDLLYEHHNATVFPAKTNDADMVYLFAQRKWEISQRVGQYNRDHGVAVDEVVRKWMRSREFKSIQKSYVNKIPQNIF